MTTAQKAAFAGTYTFTVGVTETNNRVHLHKTSPSSNYLATSATDITFTCVVTNGAVLSGTPSATVFYYTIDGGTTGNSAAAATYTDDSAVSFTLTASYTSGPVA